MNIGEIDYLQSQVALNPSSGIILFFKEIVLQHIFIGPLLRIGDGSLAQTIINQVASLDPL